jgi:nitroreductase
MSCTGADFAAGHDIITAWASCPELVCIILTKRIGYDPMHPRSHPVPNARRTKDMLPMPESSPTTIAPSLDPDAVLDLIRSRRSIGKMTDDVPDRALIEQLLEAAIWAPNHHLTQPWRFFVLSGEGRSILGRASAEAAVRGIDDPVKAEAARAGAEKKVLRAPWIIVVASEPIHDGRTPDLEEHFAVAAAAQNMLLQAEALGLAAIWRSGGPAFAPEVRDAFGLSEHGQVVGFVYVGYPAMERPTRERIPFAQVTTWLDRDSIEG